MFPCLSFFRYHAAPSCGFTGSVPTHPFAQWLIEQACCINFKIQEVTNTLSTSRLPKCAVEGKYDLAKYSGSPGETFKWFPTDRSAEYLQFRAGGAAPPVIADAPLRVGILHRESNRKFKDVPGLVSQIEADLGVTPDQISFEGKSFDVQARWMMERDLVIAAHGGAMTWGAWLGPCSVLLQIYPEHYYPVYFFE